MSRIYFHSEHDGTAEVGGSERARMDMMLESMAKGVLDLTMGHHFGRSYLYEPLRPFINPEGRLGQVGEREFDEALAGVLINRSLFDYAPTFAYKGKPIRLTSLIANTAMAYGSDAVRLAAKIHYTCESHGYVQGFHRKWLADVIEEGLEERVFRAGFWDYADENAGLKHLMNIETTEEERKPYFRPFGWQDVIELLRASTRGPVVMSFSVCESFPNSGVGDWMPPWPEGVERTWEALSEEEQERRSKRSEEWDDLSEAKQWAISVKGLKDPKRKMFNEPITPQNLRTYRFGHELSLLDLVHGGEELVARKLKVND